MRFDTAWRTSTAVALAENIRQSRDWSLLPILADSLEDAGADGSALAPLRDPGIASPLSGLWLAGVLGRGELWEWGQGWEELAQSPNCELISSGVGTRCSERIGVFCRPCQLRSRREQLRLANTGGRGERWDECRCPCCEGKGEPRGYGQRIICHVCGGTGNLLKLRDEDIGPGGPHPWYDRPRPISYSLGPLPVVTVRLEEMVRESACPERHDLLRGWHDTVLHGQWIERYSSELAHRNAGCKTCSGTGVTHVPSEWLKALPPEYDLALEGVEPNRFSQHSGVSGPGTFRGENTNYWITSSDSDSRIGEGMWLPTFLRPHLGGYIWDCGPAPHYDSIGHYFASPAAALTCLRAALRRWRYS